MNTDKLKGIAIVSLGEGLKLGRVDAPLFDPATLQLRAFQAKGDGQLFVVPFDLVRTIGKDAVMVESSAATRIASKDGEFSTLVEFSQLQQLKVVDSAGTLVGTLQELDVDPATGRPLRIVVHKGGMLGLGGETVTIDTAAIRAIGTGIITVTDVVTAATT